MPYVAPVEVVGGQGGGPCSFDGAQNGAVLKKLDVWAGPTQVRCIKVQMSDGNERMFGREGDNHYSFTFEDGEKFTSLTLWPNNAGNRLGGIKFTTSNNRSFEAFMTNGKPSVPAREADVGSGICFGVQAGDKLAIPAHQANEASHFLLGGGNWEGTNGFHLVHLRHYFSKPNDKSQILPVLMSHTLFGLMVYPAAWMHCKTSLRWNT
uniref:Jacalin-type lectin domain-containing protein n=1 Tax=Oryzias latipes TaxID=8090 RepID=A0A3P9KIK3_ORYLA